VGSLQLRVPRVGEGSSFPILLEPRRRAERALVAVVPEAYVQGIATRRVDERGQTLGLAGMSKSQVSLLCQELEAEVERFRSRPLSGAGSPYQRRRLSVSAAPALRISGAGSPSGGLDAPFIKGRPAGRVGAPAVVIALGLNATTGQREVLGLDVGPVPRTAPSGWVSGGDWSLAGGPAGRRAGGQLVVSDAHEGLQAAISSVLHGSSWHRCRVHFVRNALAFVPQSAAQLVAATIRTVFAQPEPEVARAQWRQVADSFRPRYPKRAALLAAAQADVLAYLAFPPEHGRQIWSTNPLAPIPQFGLTHVRDFG